MSSKGFQRKHRAGFNGRLFDRTVNEILVYKMILSNPVKGILRYLCIMICAFSLSIVLMSIGLIYEDFDENEQKIRSAR